MKSVRKRERKKKEKSPVHWGWGKELRVRLGRWEVGKERCFKSHSACQIAKHNPGHTLTLGTTPPRLHTHLRSMQPFHHISPEQKPCYCRHCSLWSDPRAETLLLPLLFSVIWSQVRHGPWLPLWPSVFSKAVAGLWFLPPLPAQTMIEKLLSSLDCRNCFFSPSNVLLSISHHVRRHSGDAIAPAEQTF